MTQQIPTMTGKPNAPTLAKLTPPALVGVLARTRLFRLLGDGRKRPIIWISAPAGAGKTTLIASYLQEKNLPALWYRIDVGDGDIGAFFYYMGIAAASASPRQHKPLPLLPSDSSTDLDVFTVNYFRELFERVERPSFVVFDNFQDVQSEALHQVLQRGFEQIPANATVVVISREEPPGAFARARASDRIALLNWEQLKLTEDESATLSSLRIAQTPSRSMLDEIYRRTQGWIAGVVLLTENLGKHSTESMLAAEADQSIFDYFANEIFDCASESARSFLLRTAYLPTISIAIARRLADAADCEEILRSLRQRNFFTVRHTDGTYQYHPLFRSFLLNRIQSVYSRDEVDALKRRSAELLAEDGQIEMAVALLMDAHDWQSCLDLVLKHAHTLNLQGRSRTLQSWLMSVPHELREHTPWASYWLGVCYLPFDPTHARIYFEKAFAIFEKGSDASPLYLTWSRIIDTFMFEMENYRPMGTWLDRYQTLDQGYAAPSAGIAAASVFTYISALIHARFGHPDLDVYLQRAELLLAKESQPHREIARALSLLPYYQWKGDMIKMGAMLDKIMTRLDKSDGQVVLRLHALMWKSIYAAASANANTSLQASEEGLALAERCGIHVTDSQLCAYAIWGQLCVGNVEQARKLLDKLSLIPRAGQVDYGMYQHYVAAVALHEGDIDLAVEAAGRAADIATTSNNSIGAVSFSIGYAFALAHRGKPEEALTLLLDLQPRTSATQTLFFTSFSALCEANIRHLRGEKAALQKLREALSMARSGGFVLPAYCPRETASKLCVLALDHGIESDYVRTIISKMRLSRPPECAVDRWPWSVRITALGHFTVLKDDAPVSFGSRAHHKPLALLRALAARGGHSVSTTELAQMLWPDSDGDMAAHALRTTLYRLRKFVGEECVETSGGRLRLNSHYCWVDVGEVEQFLESGVIQDVERVERLLVLLRGPLLKGADAPWILVERARLHGRIADALTQMGEAFDAARNYEIALKCYLKGVEMTPYTEKLYRHIMRCYRQLNRPAAAIALYERCRQMFSSTLKTDLAAETHALHDEIGRAVPHAGNSNFNA